MSTEDEDDGDDAEVAPSRATARAESRFPLAFDANGNPIEIPPNAVAWRVRRGGGRRGRPRHVFDSETGRQLEIPLGAGLDDLLDGGCNADRYLLYPIDAEGRVIAGIVAVTEVPEGAGDDHGEQPAPNSEHPMMAALIAALREQQATIREKEITNRSLADAMARSIEATTSGYGRVRPIAEPAPVIVEQPAAHVDSGGLKPEQITEYANLAKVLFDMLRGMGASGGGAPPMGGAA
jgi:hypothetical protein